MLKRICLFMATISFSALYAISALAQSCDLAPTCAELGFTQTTSECIGLRTLVCPFDKNAVFCGEINTKSSRLDWLHSVDSFSQSQQKNWEFPTVYNGYVIKAIYHMPQDGCIFFDFSTTNYFVSLKSGDITRKLPPTVVTQSSVYCANSGDEFIFLAYSSTGNQAQKQFDWFQTGIETWFFYYIPYN